MAWHGPALYITAAFGRSSHTPLIGPALPIFDLPKCDDLLLLSARPLVPPPVGQRENPERKRGKEKEGGVICCFLFLGEEEAKSGKGEREYSPSSRRRTLRCDNCDRKGGKRKWREGKKEEEEEVPSLFFGFKRGGGKRKEQLKNRGILIAPARQSRGGRRVVQKGKKRGRGGKKWSSV